MGGKEGPRRYTCVAGLAGWRGRGGGVRGAVHCLPRGAWGRRGEGRSPQLAAGMGWDGIRSPPVHLRDEVAFCRGRGGRLTTRCMQALEGGGAATSMGGEGKGGL